LLSSRAATNKRGAIGSGTLFKQCSSEAEHKHFMLEQGDEISSRGRGRLLDLDQAHNEAYLSNRTFQLSNYLKDINLRLWRRILF
jgi:hypothetical protein